MGQGPPVKTPDCDECGSNKEVSNFDRQGKPTLWYCDACANHFHYPNPVTRLENSIERIRKSAILLEPHIREHSHIMTAYHDLVNTRLVLMALLDQLKETYPS